MLSVRALVTFVLCISFLSGCATPQTAPSQPVLTQYSDGPAGLVDGRLAPCPQERCITSDAVVAPEIGIEPFRFPEQSPEYVWFSLRESIVALRGRITRDSTVYLAAEFVHDGGYADDLEIRIDWKQRVIHWRSATRVGDESFDGLRKRLELLRTALAARLSHPR